MRLVRCALVSLLGATLVIGSMAADEPPKIYECTDADGNVVYRDEPCDAVAPVKPAAPAAPKSTKPVPPKSKAATKSKPAPKPQAAVKPITFVVPQQARPTVPSIAVPPRNRDVDARWLSPEKTLKTFLAAVEGGDRALILSCLTSSALADFGPDPEGLPLDELRKTVGSFTGYVAEGDLGPYWSIRALRAGMRPKWIFFERTGDGEWKIGAL